MIDSARERAAAWVPRWWRGEAGAAGRLLHRSLAPAEVLYGAVVAARNRAFDRGWLAAERAPIPVLSVGNIGVGGAGKTPFAAWLAQQIAARGARPALVLRGYGEDELRVHRELNPEIPVLAAPRRIDGVREAAARGCRAAVLDDGFQHRAIARDLDLLLVAAETWGPSPRLLPRGPWRERVAAARRADLVVVTRKSATSRAAAGVADALGIVVGAERVVQCEIAPRELRPLHGGAPLPLPDVRGMDVLAVAALALPQPFADNLAALGARVELAAFRDHHEFTAAEAGALLGRAGGRPLVMTLKDAVKLRPLLPPGAPAWILHQQVRIERGENALLDAVIRAIREERR